MTSNFFKTMITLMGLSAWVNEDSGTNLFNPEDFEHWDTLRVTLDSLESDLYGRDFVNHRAALTHIRDAISEVRTCLSSSFNRAVCTCKDNVRDHLSNVWDFLDDAIWTLRPDAPWTSSPPKPSPVPITASELARAAFALAGLAKMKVVNGCAVRRIGNIY